MTGAQWQDLFVMTRHLNHEHGEYCDGGGCSRTWRRGQCLLASICCRASGWLPWSPRSCWILCRTYLGWNPLKSEWGWEITREGGSCHVMSWLTQVMPAPSTANRAQTGGWLTLRHCLVRVWWGGKKRSLRGLWIWRTFKNTTYKCWVVCWRGVGGWVMTTHYPGNERLLSLISQVTLWDFCRQKSSLIKD